jgi:transposase
MSQREFWDGATSQSKPARVDESEAPRVLTADRRQLAFRTIDLDSLLAADHPARAMWKAVEKLDLSKLYAKIQARGSRAGRSATDPKILLCLWLYATSEGQSSAREVERLSTTHDVYRWICGGVSVNHHTLGDFRVDHGDALDGLLTQVLGVLLKEKLVTLYRVAQDGMKVRASAGAGSFRRKPTLEQCLSEARKHVSKVKAQPDDGQQGARQKAAQERAAREREERIARALEQIPKVQAGKKDAMAKEQARASTTDPEARVMKMGDGGYRPAYNVQLATDVESRVVVGVAVTNAGGDAGQMTPMLEQIERRTGSRPGEYLVDGGYVNHEAIEAATDNEVRVFAPVPAARKEGVDPYAPKPDDSDAVAAWRKRMTTDEAKEVYKERAATAETTNADLREHRGLTQFNVRGLDKVTCMALLGALTLNVLRWIAA